MTGATPFQRVGGRKFVVAMTSIATTTVSVACGWIDPPVYSAVMIATAAAYITGNVAQRVFAEKVPA